MPGKFSDAGDNIAIKAVVGITPSANRFLALCSTAPADGALGTEIATPGTSGYTRQLVTFANPVDSSGARECRNDSVISVGPFTADLAAVSHVMLMDHATAATAANMVAYATLETTRDPASGDLIQFAIGELSWNNE